MAIVTGLALLGVGPSVAFVGSGCAQNISQKLNSGKDYRAKGAKKIRFRDDGRWRSSKDVVTYPGGDRVDWKVLEIPAETPPGGTLTVKVKFDLPRPGLDLAFEVFDAFNYSVGKARPAKGEDRREQEMFGNTKKVTVKNAKPGKYFVMVYAPKRTDAARYKVEAKLTEAKAGAEPDAIADLPDPPKLAAIPAPKEPVPCAEDPSKFEPNCPKKPVPCAEDPSRFEPDCPVPEKVEPMKGRIVDFTISARGGIVIKIDRGKKHGVTKGWTGQVTSKSGEPIDGGDFKIFRVTSQESQGKVRISVDQVRANQRVKISPPN